MTELRPCPFCGGKAEAYGEPGRFWIRCSKCSAFGPGNYESEDVAAEEWNRRAVQTCRMDNTDNEETMIGYPIRIWECSKCGRSHEEVYGDYDYCPNCGCKVESVSGKEIGHES